MCGMHKWTSSPPAGWGVELHRAHNALVGETMGLRKKSGNGSNGSGSDSDLSFADKHGLGNKVGGKEDYMFTNKRMTTNAPCA